MRNKAASLLMGLFIVLFVGTIILLIILDAQQPVQSANMIAPTATINRRRPTPTIDVNRVGIGIHIVGEEIMPGLYRGNLDWMFDECYWARLSATSPVEVIEADTVIGRFYFEVLRTDP